VLWTGRDLERLIFYIFTSHTWHGIIKPVHMLTNNCRYMWVTKELLKNTFGQFHVTDITFWREFCCLNYKYVINSSLNFNYLFITMFYFIIIFKPYREEFINCLQLSDIDHDSSCYGHYVKRTPFSVSHFQVHFLRMLMS
jgi:hypothetical protein